MAISCRMDSFLETERNNVKSIISTDRASAAIGPERIIVPMEEKYLLSSLELVEDVFAKWDSPKEGKVV